MACLGAALYDPATLATKSMAAALAMTAFDTTNARVTFTAPTNGSVLVKIRVASKGAAGTPRMLLGVLEGSTVRGRVAAVAPIRTGGSSTLRVWEGIFVVTGLTAGNSYTWDAAYGNEFGVASYLLGYGGPNNATASDAYGALGFEVWEAVNLLAGAHYDPATVATKSTATAAALAAIDTTNLRLSVAVPASGLVVARMRGVITGGATLPSVHLGILEGSTVRMRQPPICDFSEGGTVGVTSWAPFEAMAVIPGLSAGTVNWDAAWATETGITSSAIKYGGPNNTTADDAYGGFEFDVWTA